MTDLVYASAVSRCRPRLSDNMVYRPEVRPDVELALIKSLKLRGRVLRAAGIIINAIVMLLLLIGVATLGRDVLPGLGFAAILSALGWILAVLIWKRFVRHKVENIRRKEQSRQAALRPQARRPRSSVQEMDFD